MPRDSESNILLVILGHSPLIVPEAVWTGKKNYGYVHIITTDNKKLLESINLLSGGFRQYLPDCSLSITAVHGLDLPESTLDYAQFEEALFQWYIEKAGDILPDVCISGGIKTMPATMQQAARYFGAADVFHVIANMPKDANPASFEEANRAVREGRISRISLGAEPGWHTLKTLFPKERFSPTLPPDGDRTWHLKQKPAQPEFSAAIRQVMQRVRQQAIGEGLINLPFGRLQLLTDEQINWLESPLDEEKDMEWVRQLPKAELHCHLGGFATHGDLLEQVRSAAADPQKLPPAHTPALPEGWPRPAQPISLVQYMQLGNANGSKLLFDSGCLQKQVELLYHHFQQQNVRYAEVRCSPDNYQQETRSAWDVLADIQHHFEECMRKAAETNEGRFCQLNLLVIVTRKTAGDLSGISRHVALAITASRKKRNKDLPSCHVVGIDLAGYEDKETRAAYYVQDFLGVHRCGLAVTAHAGENDDAEGIWQAVYHLHARRIGHALSLLEAPDLLRTIADRKIGIEMCPYANYQIKGFAPMPGNATAYPLLQYLREGLQVTVNTDNIGISGASISDNIIFLASLCPGIKRIEILKLIRNSLEAAFISTHERNHLLQIFEKAIFESIPQRSLYENHTRSHLPGYE